MNSIYLYIYKLSIKPDGKNRGNFHFRQRKKPGKNRELPFTEKTGKKPVFFRERKKYPLRGYR